MHKNGVGNVWKKMGGILLNVLCVSMSIASVLPIVWLFYSSLKTNSEFMLDALSLPSKCMFGNYPKAFDLGNLWGAIKNSAIYSVINITLVNFSALLVGYFISRYEFKGKKFMYYVYMVGMLIPSYALLVPVFLQYRILDLLNTRIALIITYYALNMPLAIFLYESFILNIPNDIDEASIIDGCSMLQRIYMIILPLCKPITATVSILTLLQTWNEFGFAVVLNAEAAMRTVSVALRSYSTGMEVEYTFFMAGLFAAAIPVLVAYAFFSGQIVKGMTAGAVKG